MFICSLDVCYVIEYECEKMMYYYRKLSVLSKSETAILKILSQYMQ